jgi:two-component system KDP operon response regulator KdpE
VTTQKPQILAVDDEPATLKYVSANLRARGYDIVTASNGREALEAALKTQFDLVLLDLMMPGMDGFEVCQKLRQTSEVPIVILSARGQERDKVKALDMGADDYLTKPFGVEELLARVRAVLRRGTPVAQAATQRANVGDLEVDFEGRRVRVKDAEVRLTPTEFNLLAFLVKNAGKVMSHRTILQSVWGPEYGQENDYLWAYVCRLRRKIESDPDNPKHLVTEAGVGYSFRTAQP